MLPEELIVSLAWTATGQMAVDAYKDATGTPTLQIVHRSRAASVDVAFSYPDNDGPLALPAMQVSSVIFCYRQTAVGS